ncbi:unnamed protein product (macronuclear) [Paramecium tetraurelia]|uniref:Uncharacterized protein n=1 Tax=Paramecium tetraurelia TaxID=5888 RepID=A0CLH9_PARTE|nr:uncharacterized protein GSPATT00008194001 [Paramecium tetraurelia]CAK71646.1 unnamed protein product [Paramecium tetraurelia]|eukprot:XP_001439043.1 hypothetical protein (macronuclear) [Paramecium tetraurelia strain d4-2]
MGVPNFYSWLSKRYPMCKYPFTKHHGHQIDFLYLDMNQVIYKCATNQTILKDYMIEKSIESLWTSILNYIDTIINLVDPQLVIYLTFDGVAPRAKANQQRQRRFASSKGDAKIKQLLKQLDLEQQNHTFKNNQITAGTEFMYELNEQVKFFINRKFKEDEKYANLQVIFSGSDVPGEGEHKILEFMRGIKNQQNFNPDWTHCIYSADADLIMLGLGIHLKYVSIIREQSNMDQIKTQIACKRSIETVKFELINLQIVKEYLDLEYKTIQMKIPYNIDRVIDDFLLLFFLIGNDFLPRVYCFDIKQGTVELLIDTFKSFLEQCDEYVTQDGWINWKSMSLLVQVLSKFEIKAIEKRVEELKKQIKDTDNPEYQDYKIQWESELKILDALNIQFSNNNSVVARKLFYESKCQIDIDTEEGKKELDKIILKYLEGFQFVLSYYYHGVPSWEWYYSYYYSPMCFDLCVYLSKNQIEKIQFGQSKPYDPFQQLLLILPPHNANLLPAPFRGLYDLESPLRKPFDYYPDEYEIDPFGAIWEHQFICKVPFMNSDLLISEYKKIDQSQLNELERERSKFGHAYLFVQTKIKGDSIQSKLPKIFKNKKYRTEQIQLNGNIHQDAQEVLSRIKNQKVKQNELPILPSLHVLKINKTWLQNKKDKHKNQRVLKVELASKNLDFLDKIESASDQTQTFDCYCGYPQNYYGEVALVVSKKSFLFLKNYQLKNMQILSEFRDDILDEVKNDIYDHLKYTMQTRLENQGIFLESINAIAVVYFYKEIIRNPDRTLGYNMLNVREEVMPLEWISDQKIVELVDYRLENQIDLINQKVIVVNNDKNQICGSIGCVEKKINQDQYIVKILRQPILQTDNNKIKVQKFFDIGFVSEKLNIPPEIIHYILGCIKIFIGDKKKQTDIIVQQIDIGFNAVHKGKNQLVPELLRINEAQFDSEGYEKFKQFEKAQLSETLVTDLEEYAKRLPELIKFLKSVGKEKLRSLQQIKITDIFKDDVQAGINTILKHYTWLLMLPTSQYTLCNVASSTYSSQTIKALEESKQSQKVQRTLFTHKFWLLNQEKFYVPPLMTEHPKIHKLGDRVVALNNNYTNFGAYGVVVGVIDNGEIMIEVLWDKPRFGQTDLGGRCSPLRGSLVRFLDIFNITQQWQEQLNTYSGGAKGHQVESWTYKQKVFVPSHEKPDYKKKKQHQPKQGQTQ